MNNLYEVLQERFGFESFRPGQKEVIQHVLNRQDTIAILPTGMGKSLCYQLPAYIMPGPVLIISPLVSLMEDQVMQIRKNGEKRVVALNSALPYTERQNVIRQLAYYKFIFVSPEMLTQESLVHHLRKVELSMIVVDEAHCISQWGYDFRPDYLRIGDFLSSTEGPPILALTATADKKVLGDIRRYLHMKQPVIERQSLDRPNIAYSIIKLFSSVEKTEWIKNQLINTTGPGIIYASSRKRADELAFELQSVGISVESYHAGKEQDDRSIIQEQFLNGHIDWICATNAFGMGVHKDNVRQVIHDHLPSTIASYIQEVGRAGRDGQPSMATLLYMPTDEKVTSFIINADMPSAVELRLYAKLLSDGVELSKAVELASLTDTGRRVIDYYMERFSVDDISILLDKISEEKELQLQKMLSLINGDRCIRENILSYFDEICIEKPEHCCSFCGFSRMDWLSDKITKKNKKENRNWDEIITNLLG